MREFDIRRIEMIEISPTGKTVGATPCGCPKSGGWVHPEGQALGPAPTYSRIIWVYALNGMIIADICLPYALSVELKISAEDTGSRVRSYGGFETVV